MIRRSPLKRGKPPKKRSAKRGREIIRTMGSKARRLFVASLPCAACGVVGYSVNAHLLGPLGMGIKKDATTIGPLCGPRPTKPMDFVGFIGCHRQYDEYRDVFDYKWPDFNAAAVCEWTEQAWQQSTHTVEARSE